MTLKRILKQIGITPEQIASLESNGYCIVPMEATDEMTDNSLSNTGWVIDEQTRMIKRKSWSFMLAARPRLTDE